MTVKIEKIAVVVPGQVVRKFDGTDTTLTLNGEQVQNLHSQLGEVAPLFNQANELPLNNITHPDV